MRTQARFWLLAASLAVIILFSLALEYLRLSASGVSISADNISRWRVLWGGLPGLLGLVAVLAVSAAFVRDVYNIPGWGAALGYVWSLLFGAAPLSLLDLLLGVSSTPSFLIVQEGRIDEKREDTPLARLGGPGRVLIFGDSAVVLERFGRFTRVAGPGSIFLRRFERIREVLDLRPQKRSEATTALTRDNIPVQTTVHVRFQLARPPASLLPSTPDIPHPVYKWALIRASQCNRRLVLMANGVERIHHWPERVMGNVGSTMRPLIATYTLDELLEPYEPDRDPRREIIQTFHRQLDASARNFGAQVLDVRMDALKPTLEEVEQERVASWQAVWKAQVRKERAKGEAEAIRQQGLARAYAQMEIILSITRELQEVATRDQALSAEFIALRFIEALRQAWARPEGRIVPFEALRTLEYLQAYIKREYALPGPETSDES